MAPIPNSPDVVVTIRDGALGASAGAGADALAIIGPATGPTVSPSTSVVNTVYGYRDVQSLVNDHVAENSSTSMRWPTIMFIRRRSVSVTGRMMKVESNSSGVTMMYRNGGTPEGNSAANRAASRPTAVTRRPRRSASRTTN